VSARISKSTIPVPASYTETDLYASVRDLFIQQGFTVRGEVDGCDLAAVRGNELVVVELKTAFNTALLIQATDRQRAADAVYVALPHPQKTLTTGRWAGILHLLRRLEIGLIFVRRPQTTRQAVSVAEIILEPKPYTPRRQTRARQSILREAKSRTADYNVGGSVRKPLVTAYREQALQIASCLATLGDLSPRALQALGTSAKTQTILATNVYGWFERVSHGIYRLTEKGQQSLVTYEHVATPYLHYVQERTQGASTHEDAIT